MIDLSLYSEDEGRELCRKRGSEFKLPYPIIDIHGCDSPQTNLLVTSSTSDDKSQPSLVAPVAGKKPSTPKNARKRKKDGSLLTLYPAGNELKNRNELMQQYQAGIGEPYRANSYHDMMVACNEYSRIQPMLMGCRGDYDDEDMIKMRNDVTDCRCYYGNGITSSTPAAGAGAWYWAPENTQLATYLYDQQQYLADYSMYRRLVTSPPPSLSNGYEALPVATAGAPYEALTPPDDDSNCLHPVTTATAAAFPHRPHHADEGDNGDEMLAGGCRRSDVTDHFVTNSNSINNNTSVAGGVTSVVTGVGHGGYGVATPVIQMSAKSRYRVSKRSLHSLLSTFISLCISSLSLSVCLFVSVHLP